MWDLSKYKCIFGFTATVGDYLTDVIKHTITPDLWHHKMPSEFEYLSGCSHIDAQFFNVPPGQVLETIVKKVKMLYKTSPMVLFLEETDITKLAEMAKKEQWKIYSSAQVSEILTKIEGLLILRSIESRGLNTPFAVTATVLIGCELEDESEHVQMTGRSCRTRGINHSEYYFDKWQNEADVRTSWKRNSFTKS